jgi:elongation factor Ts
MAVSADNIRKLRESTGAGIMDCRKALEDTDGSIEKAVALLREQGAAKALAKEGRKAEEGVVMAYVHHGGKLGSLIELNCETDFVARNEEFVTLARELAMQVAATSPKYVTKEEVPAEVIESQRAEAREQAATLGRDSEAHIRDKVEQFISNACLMEQPYIRDAAVTVQSLITDKVAKFGERMRVKRFTVFKLGEGVEEGENK